MTLIVISKKIYNTLCLKIKTLQKMLTLTKKIASSEAFSPQKSSGHFSIRKATHPYFPVIFSILGAQNKRFTRLNLYKINYKEIHNDDYMS